MECNASGRVQTRVTRPPMALTCICTRSKKLDRGGRQSEWSRPRSRNSTLRDEGNVVYDAYVRYVLRVHLCVGCCSADRAASSVRGRPGARLLVCTRVRVSASAAPCPAAKASAAASTSKYYFTSNAQKRKHAQSM